MNQIISYNELDVKAPQGAFSTLDAEIFVPEIQKLKPDQVYLEIGVDKGKSLWIAKQVAKEGVEIHGVDIQEDPVILGTNFHQGNSIILGQEWKGPKIDVLFIDGDHSMWGCHMDIKSWFPHMAENGVMLFHDCDESSPGVVQAVAEFVDTKRNAIKSWELFKRTDKNTSMSKIQL